MDEIEALALAAAAKKRKAAELGFPAEPGGVSTNSQAVGEFKGKLDSTVRGGIQGAVAGLEDNVAGARAAVTNQTRTPEGNLAFDDSGYISGFGDRYRAERDATRLEQGQAEAANPALFNTAKVGGATVTGLAASPLATGNTLLQTMGRGGVIGAIEGALHEIGNADGENVGSAAGKGLIWGGGLGAVAPALVGAGGRVKDMMTGGVDTVLNRENISKAGRAVGDVLRGSGKSPDDVMRAIQTAAREGQPEYRLMDATGVAGQRAASGIARQGGDAATQIAEFLEKRQMGQGERVGSFVDDSFGVSGTTAAQRADELTRARGDAANANYDAARGNAAPVDVRGALGVIDSRIGGMQGSGVAGDGIDGKLNKYRQRLAADPAPDGEISRELSDFDRVLGVKQEVQDDIGAAIRAGRNNEARELGKLLSELDGALEQSSDMYRTANDSFREASKVIDAVPEGAQMATRGRAADNVPRFQSMTPDQQAAARVGYGDTLLNKLEAVTSPTSNRAKPLQSFKRETEAGAMSLDPELYGRRLSRENEMWGTQNRALGGSRTADNEADKSAMGELAGGAWDAAKSGLNFQLGDAVQKIANIIGPVVSGSNDATRQAIARALMSSDPQAALAPLLRQDMRSQSQRRIIETLIRNSGRESALQ